MKKKIVCIIIILITLILAFQIVLTNTVYAAETKVELRGDVNFDEQLTVTDLSIIKEFLVDKIDLYGEQKLRADVSGDGKYTALDMSLLKMILIGLIDPIYMDGETNKDGKVTVLFKNYNGVLLQTVEVAEGEEAVYTGPTPTRDSDIQNTYTFSGWETTVNELTKNIIKTAQYTKSAREYTITFKNYDGTILETKSVAYGETPTYTGPTPVKPDSDGNIYTFNGWGTLISVIGDKEYVAQYTTAVKKYTITYNLNGAEGAISAQTKTHGIAINLTSAEPSMAGYRFLGWATEQTATLPDYSAGELYTQNSDITLYAVWEAITYVISYDLNGATGTAPASQIKYHNQTITLREDIPTREGYIFLGWALSVSATEADYEAGSELLSGINRDTIMYAVWQVKPWDGSIATGFAGGDGTIMNPWKIAIPSQLAYFAEIVNPDSQLYNESYCDDYFEVIATLDLNNLSWLPINSVNFTGSFDGNNDLGYIIKNLKIDSTRPITLSYTDDYGENTYISDAAGLFAYNAGTIYNVTLRGEIGVTTNNEVDMLFVGSIAAINTGVIRGCESSVTINAASSVTDIEIEAGGIVGINLVATVMNCKNTGTVTASATNGLVAVGGIAGENGESTLTGCTNTAVISGNSLENAIGGIAGLYYGGLISNNTNTGTPATHLGMENLID